MQGGDGGAKSAVVRKVRACARARVLLDGGAKKKNIPAADTHTAH
jgi:hypothetical protein